MSRSEAVQDREIERTKDHDGNVYPEYPGDPRVPTADRARSVAGHRPSRSEGRTGGQDRRAVEQRDAGYTSDVHDSVSRRPRGPNLGTEALPSTFTSN